MDRRRYQFSLGSLLVLTTVCAVLLSLVKTFPRASTVVASLGLMSVGPLLFFLGAILVYHSELFFPDATRWIRVFAFLAGLLCIITGIALFLLSHCFGIG
jgi:hypothetical protein